MKSTYVKDTAGLISLLQTTITDLEQTAELAAPSLMAVEQFKGHFYSLQSYTKVKRTWSSEDEPKTLAELDGCSMNFEGACNRFIDKMDKHDESQAEAIANNEAWKVVVERFLSNVGLKSTFNTFERPTARHKNKKHITHASGWVNDIKRVAVTSTGTAVHRNSVIKVRADFTRWFETKTKAIKKELADAARIEATKTKNLVAARVVGALAQAYFPDNMDVTPDDIKEHLLESCKYLRLATAGESTRNDWNEGFYQVRNALDSFTVENTHDQFIEDCYSDILDGEEDDGRIFRDCKYDYGTLYGMVDSKLLKEYHAILPHCDGYEDY